MAKSLNRVDVLGNVGADPELRSTPTGTAVINFTIATTDRWTDKSGEQKEDTEWHRLVAWGKTAELIGQYVQKGNRLFITGKLQTRKWQDKSGGDRYSTEIVVQDFTLLTPRSGESTPQQGSQSRQPAQAQKEAPAHVSDDDLPF